MVRTTLMVLAGSIALGGCDVVEPSDVAAGLIEAVEPAPAAPVILSAAADTTVRSDVDARRNDNHGAQTSLLVGGNRGGSDAPDAIRTLLHFPIERVQRPIEKATLLLDVLWTGGAPADFQLKVNRLLPAAGCEGSWQEGNGTEEEDFPAPGSVWVDEAHGVAWSGHDDGGDANNQSQPRFDPTVWGTTSVQQSAQRPGTVVSIDVTRLVQLWQTGAVPNVGMVLRDDSLIDFSEIYFASRETKFRKDRLQRALAPRLEIVTRAK